MNKKLWFFCDIQILVKILKWVSFVLLLQWDIKVWKNLYLSNMLQFKLKRFWICCLFFHRNTSSLVWNLLIWCIFFFYFVYQTQVWHLVFCLQLMLLSTVRWALDILSILTLMSWNISNSPCRKRGHALL